MKARLPLILVVLLGLTTTACAGPFDLGEDEQSELLKMREEEKLARDVYLALYDAWELPVFSNISTAEQRHMDALGRMIARYGLEDPVVDDTPGVFSNPAFTDLYNQLVASGSQSSLDALKVGALIEEMDIVDIRAALAVTTHADLAGVYENLMRGSRNHLRAFAAQIYAAGDTYEAQYLTQEEFDEIANSPWETGGNGNGHHGHARRQRNERPRHAARRP